MSDTIFDQAAYIRDTRANPAAYVPLGDCLTAVNVLQALRRASPMAELRKQYLAAHEAYREDPQMLAMLTDAKNSRKKELEKK